MNRLDPDLKRLLKWSRPALPPPPADAPFGFSSRVVARWDPNQTTPPLPEWQRQLAIAAWVSSVVILCGFAFIANQWRAPRLAIDFTSAAQFAASYLTP